MAFEFLLHLPVELIQLVASFLSLSDTASLALANHFLHATLGAHAWKELKQSGCKDEKLRFLQRLRDDLPCGHFSLCDTCIILHKRKTFNPKNKHKLLVFGPDVIRLEYGYRLSPAMVRAAMDRATRGYPHGICPDELSCTGVLTRRRGFSYSSTADRTDYAYRVFPDVEAGDLLIRLDTRVDCAYFAQTFPSVYTHKRSLARCGHHWLHRHLWAGIWDAFTARHVREPFPWYPVDPQAETPQTTYAVFDIAHAEWPSDLDGFTSGCEWCHIRMDRGDKRVRWTRMYVNVGLGKDGELRWKRLAVGNWKTELT